MNYYPNKKSTRFQLSAYSYVSQNNDKSFYKKKNEVQKLEAENPKEKR